jgi:hypothetical protein
MEGDLAAQLGIYLDGIAAGIRANRLAQHDA